MDRYFRYQLSQLPARPLRDWGKFRWQDNLLSVLWLYNRTGDAYLLDLARLLHQEGHDWIAQSSRASPGGNEARVAICTRPSVFM